METCYKAFENLDSRDIGELTAKGPSVDEYSETIGKGSELGKGNVG